MTFGKLRRRLIDEHAVFESVLLERPLDHKTIIKNLFFFPGATIGEYNLANKNLSLKTYWEVRYVPNDRLDIMLLLSS